MLYKTCLVVNLTVNTTLTYKIGVSVIMQQSGKKNGAWNLRHFIIVQPFSTGSCDLSCSSYQIRNQNREILNYDTMKLLFLLWILPVTLGGKKQIYILTFNLTKYSIFFYISLKNVVSHTVTLALTIIFPYNFVLHTWITCFELNVLFSIITQIHSWYFYHVGIYWLINTTLCLHFSLLW